MPALRPRTVFAASFVMTVAACGKKDTGGGGGGGGGGGERSGFATTWSVSKGRDSSAPKEWCHGVSYAPCPEGATCNPPAPQPMPCPPGMVENGHATVAQKSETECVLVPDGCRDYSCATQKVRCPWTYEELPRLMRHGSKDADGRCFASWQPPIHSKPQFVMPCPDGVTRFQITRADLDQPCVLTADGVAPKEIPCPTEPALFANADAFAKERASLVGKRAQIQATKHTLAATGCGESVPNDGTRVVVDGVVTASGPLADCVIWLF